MVSSGLWGKNVPLVFLLKWLVGNNGSSEGCIKVLTDRMQVLTDVFLCRRSGCGSFKQARGVSEFEYVACVLKVSRLNTQLS